MRPRKTIARPVAMEGVGLHTGRLVHVSLQPNPGKGRICRRVDRGNAEIPLRLDCVDRVEWATALSANSCRVSTVEHLLAVLYALEIDDVVVEVDGEELPATDGSSREYLQLLEAAGTVESGEPVEPLIVRQPVWIPGEAKHIIAFPNDRLTITCAVDYHHEVIGRQLVTVEVTAASFKAELAEARTFALIEWVEALRGKGLAQGGSPDNAVVVYRDHYSTALRFDDEMVRHKALDLVGDIALIGRPVYAHLIAVRCSHAMHIEMARQLVEQEGEAYHEPSA